MLGVSHILLDEYEDAVEWCRKATQYATSGWWPHLNLSVALVGLNRFRDARAALKQAVRLQPDLSRKSIATTMLRNLTPEHKDGYLEKLREAGLPE